ncbi:MAG: threonylcarbamoyl-AMP synthase [Desulfatitalea sp.]|nr:threonylcarbamoyl-AMP synthase [Desulfatitalea sp.]NNK02072.1 threonylcarbamoyl-AMP synthase [Desulfatitalea sp.]
MANIVHVDAERPDADTLQRAARLIRQGGLVVFPTLGLYGIGGDALNPQVVERIFSLKGRQAAKPLLVIIDTLRMLDRVAQPPTPMARGLMNRFWPGKVTFVLTARPGLPTGLTAGSGKIGVRQVRHPVAAALVKLMQGPLTGTSANLSGAGGCSEVSQIEPGLISGVDLVLDAGRLKGHGSTVVDVSGEQPLLLRQGAVAFEKIMAAFGSNSRIVSQRKKKQKKMI